MVACWCRDLRARLEIAIERVLALVQQVEKQKAASPSHSRRSSSCEEVQYSSISAIIVTYFKFLINVLF